MLNSEAPSSQVQRPGVGTAGGGPRWPTKLSGAVPVPNNRTLTVLTVPHSLRGLHKGKAPEPHISFAGMQTWVSGMTAEGLVALFSPAHSFW